MSIDSELQKQKLTGASPVHFRQLEYLSNYKTFKPVKSPLVFSVSDQLPSALPLHIPRLPASTDVKLPLKFLHAFQVLLIIFEGVPSEDFFPPCGTGVHGRVFT